MSGRLKDIVLSVSMLRFQYIIIIIIIIIILCITHNLKQKNLTLLKHSECK